MSITDVVLDEEAGRRVGAQHVLDADYFRRIDALHFTMEHDDGQLPDDIDEADIARFQPNAPAEAAVRGAAERRAELSLPLADFRDATDSAVNDFQLSEDTDAGYLQTRIDHGANQWVLGMDLTPLQFMILAQVIIFLLGWPLEWTEIIVIFVPIFLPLLQHFQIDPMLWGVLVFVNLQAAFLSPPVAMSAFYLKGVSPPHVTINQIFAGMMPYMLIVIVCMVLMYIWPGLTLWLPNYLYGK